jgi:hypothetical protein
MRVLSLPSTLKKIVTKIKKQLRTNNSGYGIPGLTPHNLIAGHYNFGKLYCARRQYRAKQGTAVTNDKSTLH